MRVNLPAKAMPANTGGQRIAVGPYNRNDGFSPGSAIVLHVPGLDTQAAMNRTGAVAADQHGAARSPSASRSS